MTGNDSVFSKMLQANDGLEPRDDFYPIFGESEH